MNVCRDVVYGGVINHRHGQKASMKE